MKTQSTPSRISTRSRCARRPTLAPARCTSCCAARRRTLAAQAREHPAGGRAARADPARRCRDSPPAGRTAASRAAGGSRAANRRAPGKMAAPELPALAQPAPRACRRVPALDRQHKARRRVEAALEARAMRARSSGSSSLGSSGSTLAGRSLSFCMPVRRVLEGRQRHSRRRRRACRRGLARSAAASPIVGLARARRSARSGRRCARAARRPCASRARSAQRGRLSPGYHLPWP